MLYISQDLYCSSSIRETCDIQDIYSLYIGASQSVALRAILFAPQKNDYLMNLM